MTPILLLGCLLTALSAIADSATVDHISQMLADLLSDSGWLWLVVLSNIYNRMWCGVVCGV